MILDHIGFLTNDIEADRPVFDRLFPGTVWSERVVDPLQQVEACFGRTPQGIVYELIQPSSPASPVSANLKARKNLLNHVCYRSEDLEKTAAKMREDGFFPVTEAKPAAGFGNEPLQFFYHPNGLLLEIVQGTAGPFDRVKT